MNVTSLSPVFNGLSAVELRGLLIRRVYFLKLEKTVHLVDFPNHTKHVGPDRPARLRIAPPGADASLPPTCFVP